ncbi:glycoside hydrolase family 2 [Paenibacillus daejeonensis]|uniref:glycoside hydrolase family 2 n=1 Tax=Paenibacillus daejeonensis TaxID=135193 RepID=UPI00037D8787|nr:glycoside hydrolase family 2 [Paenibacillus daejeonensis]
MTWKVKGFWPWVPLLRNSAETGMELMGVTDWIPATVPGGVHYDLYRAGLIDDPYRDTNSLNCEWVENRWWVYKTEFTRPQVEGERLELLFKGLDYEAMIYLNGKLLGEHEGMYHPASFDVTEQWQERETVQLMVVLKHAPDEMAQIGKTSMTFTQKSRFNYKWDFSTRLVNIGLWDDVVLRAHPSHTFGEVRVSTDVDPAGQGIVTAVMELQTHGIKGEEEVTVRAVLLDPQGEQIREQVEVVTAGEDAHRAEFRLDDPALWYPNGYGDQPLYKVWIQLIAGKGTLLLDEQVYPVGIRSLKYVQNVDSPEDALPYTIVVNGKKIYIKGVNMTPLDHLYGNISRSRYEWMIRLAKHGNINMIRVWGGGLIEKPEFYELCDRHGIMVWQEFIQSSSGIDNIPSKRPEFLALLEQTAIAALKGRRNHTSLSVWSGGNELMSGDRVPSTYEDENLAMLKKLVKAHDPQRLFLPTSASGPVEHITRKKGVSHDVHGWWKYEGNPGHYELYGESDNLFHSEFGVDGMNAEKSIRKFLSEAHLEPVSMEDSMVWRHHGEWWDTYKRDLGLFGDVPDLRTFVACSQWIQAEGLRYILEANRRRKFRNSGSIVWQMNEPWPNVACTNLVDYYGESKMAYHYARKAFTPNHVSLDYRSLTYTAGETFRETVYVHRAGEPGSTAVTAEVLDSHGRVLHEQQFQGESIADQALEIGVLVFEVPSTEDQLFYVRLRMDTDAIGENGNLYVFSTREDALYAPALELEAPQIEVEQVDLSTVEASQGTEFHYRYRVTNTGSVVALHLYPEEQTDRYWLVADGAYESLFPGESIEMTITCVTRSGMLFEAGPREGDEAVQPDLVIRGFKEPKV